MILLNNQITMPVVGFGVYKIEDEALCIESVLNALQVGYRLIDTASLYHNEAFVGKAISNSNIPRKELFITTKLWIHQAGYDNALAAIDEALAKLKVDYIDLLLVHQPFGDYYGMYRALIKRYDEKILRAIGVSNFQADKLVDLCEHFPNYIPQVNQLEYHVLYQRLLEKEIAADYGCHTQAWSPIARANEQLLYHPLLKQLAAKYHKSSVQIALRYLIQQNISVVVKSVHLKRIQENYDIFDFSLSDLEMAQIATLNQGHSLYFDHRNPKEVKRLINRR